MKFDCVISLCDGIALARDSLRLAGVSFDRYIGVEIDPQARKIADYRDANDRMPPIIRWQHSGNPDCAKNKDFVDCHDIREFRGYDIPQEWLAGGKVLIIAGIPCTERSLANKNFTGKGRVAEGTDSGLIREFARIMSEVWKHLKCSAADVRLEWILENVPSAKAANDYYNTLLRTEPVEINAAWFGAQHRRRLFWSSWQITPPPPSEWSGEVFADIADDNPPGIRRDYVLWESDRRKVGKPHRVGVLPTPSVLRQIIKNKHSACSLPDGGGDQALVADVDSKMYSLKGAAVKVGGGLPDGIGDSTSAVISDKHKARCQSATHGTSDGYKIAGRGKKIKKRFVVDGEETPPLEVIKKGARFLTMGEIERLFGLPTDNTAAPGVSITARMRAIGGGWDVRQMAYCLRQIGNKKRGLI
ncbi:MAG: hypothetical protein ACR2PR_09090 [Pseudohongiellaceae bacterium]